MGIGVVVVPRLLMDFRVWGINLTDPVVGIIVAYSRNILSLSDSYRKKNYLYLILIAIVKSHEKRI
jgi:hypothetical protein